MDRSHIDRYEAIGESVANLADGLTREDLLARPGPGAWSIQELIIHLADSEAIGIDRMKRVIAEEVPTLLNYDETLYAARLHPEAQWAADALLMVALGRRQFGRVLRALPEAAFDRTGVHNIAGVMVLREMVPLYNNHVVHHLRFLRDKRARLGKGVDLKI
jgi:uncharacterized damage-inducible protein DinB